MRMSLARQASFSGLFVIYGALAAFAATLLVSWQQGSEGSGRFFQLMGLFALATSLSVWGADTGLVRSLSAYQALGSQAYTPTLLRAAALPTLAFSLTLVLGSLAWALTLPLESEQRQALFLSAPFLLLATLMTLAFGVLRGFKATAAFTFLQSALLPSLRLLGLGLALAFWGSFASLALAWMLPLILVTALALSWSARLLREHLALEQAPSAPLSAPAQASPLESSALPKDFASFWSFSAPRGLATLVETLLEWVDVLLVILFLGPAAGGIYGAVNRCVRVGAMIEHTARIVTGPEISATLASRQQEETRKIFLGSTRLLMVLGWPFYLSLAAFGPTVLAVFGPDFRAGAPLFWLVGAAMMLQLAAGGVQSLLLMSGKSRWQLYNKLSALGLALILNLALIPLWGLAGAAVAWSAAILLDTALASWQVRRYLGLKVKLAELAPAGLLALLLPALLAGLCLLLLGQGTAALGLYLLLLLPSYLVSAYYLQGPLQLPLPARLIRKDS